MLKLTPVTDDGNNPIQHPFDKIADLYEFASSDFEDSNEQQLPGDLPPMGKYIIIEKLSEGGSSSVYKAFDTALKRHVALKILNSIGTEAKTRFVREAETIAKLRHPNIVQIYETGIDENKYYIAMQYIEGMTLNRLSGTIPVETGLEIFSKVCEAIEYAHLQGVIHRDIKPHNIMIDNNNWIYVLDFGIAKLTGSDITLTTDIIGTPQYISPEQIEGNYADVQSDVYSLGATMYHCFSGTAPFDGVSHIELIANVSTNDPLPIRKLNSDIPKDLETIIHKCLYKEPDLRYQSISELKNDIDRLIKGEAILARKPSLGYTLSKKVRKNKYYIIAIASCVLLIVPVFALLYFKGTESSFKEGARSGLRDAKFIREQAQPFFDKAKEALKIAYDATDPVYRAQFSDYLEEAKSSLLMAVEADNSFAEAYLLLGEIHFKTAKYIKSAEYLTKAIEHGPSLSDAYYMRILSLCLSVTESDILRTEDSSQKQIDIAKSDLDMLKELDSHPSKIACAQTLIYLLDENFSYGALLNAGQMLSQAIIDDPTNVDAYIIRSQIRSKKARGESGHSEKTQSYKNALNDLNKAIELEPNLVSSYILAAKVSTHLNNYNDAIRYMRLARQLFPDGPKILLMEALLHIEFRHNDEAVKLLNELEKKPESFENPVELSEFCFNFGVALFKTGEKEKADTYFTKAVESAPDELKESISEQIKNFKQYSSEDSK